MACIRQSTTKTTISSTFYSSKLWSASLFLFPLEATPLIENVCSTGADEAGTDKISHATGDNWGKACAAFTQYTIGSSFSSYDQFQFQY